MDKIQAELKKYRKKADELNFTAEPVNEDIFHWDVVLQGPDDSPYAGGRFKLDVTFPQDYPFRPPKVLMRTPIFHPNIGTDSGIICDPLFDKNWSAALRIANVMKMITTLMSQPQLRSPYNVEMGRLCKENPEKYKAQARDWTKRHATGAAR